MSKTFKQLAEELGVNYISFSSEYTDVPCEDTEEHPGQQHFNFSDDKQVGGTHYSDMVIQPKDYIVKNNLTYLEGNVIKYVSRHTRKNGVEDIDKAIQYLEMIKEEVYG